MYALCEKAKTHGVTARSTLARSAATQAACAAIWPALIVHDSPLKAIQCTSGVSNEYQKDEFEPELAPAYLASARWRAA